MRSGWNSNLRRFILRQADLESIQTHADVRDYDFEGVMYYIKPTIRYVDLVLKGLDHANDLIAMIGGCKPVPFQLEFAEFRMRFDAYVTQIQPRACFDGLGSTSVTLRPTGRIEQEKIDMATYTRNGIQIPKGAEGRKALRDRQYYVGSKEVLPGGNNPNWGKPTLEAAIEHAREMIDKTGEDQFIVKIVRVCRKRKTPIDVEKV